MGVRAEDRVDEFRPEPPERTASVMISAATASAMPTRLIQVITLHSASATARAKGSARRSGIPFCDCLYFGGEMKPSGSCPAHFLSGPRPWAEVPGGGGCSSRARPGMASSFFSQYSLAVQRRFSAVRRTKAGRSGRVERPGGIRSRGPNEGRHRLDQFDLVGRSPAMSDPPGISARSVRPRTFRAQSPSLLARCAARVSSDDALLQARRRQ